MGYYLGILSHLFANHAAALFASFVLLCFSATFSGCETSLFSLSAPELNRIRAGTGRLDRTLIQLHRDLQSLLPSLLFFNMLVNVGMYSLAAGIAADLGGRYGVGIAFAYSMASLFLVVFWGEVFPKQLAIASTLSAARVTALPVWFVARFLGRPLVVLNALVAALERVFDARRTDHRGLREEELRLLVELSRDDGAISDGEYQMIDSIVDLPDVRVRDLMAPRIDFASLPPCCDFGEAVAVARKAGHCKLPVLDAENDDFAGWVDVRAFFSARTQAGGAGTIGPHVREFKYFSEHDRADQVLDRVKTIASDLFAVVDERGVVVGFFTLQDIMDEVLGHFGEHGAAPAPEIRETADGYVISGQFSVREWRDLFDVSRELPKSATVGGLVVSLLGRIPRAGDAVTLDNMRMTVLATRHNRVTEVALRLAPEDRGKTVKKISARMFVDGR